MRKTKTHYAMVGMFVVVISLVTVLLGIWLSVGLSHKDELTYQAFFTESVDGLSVKAPVKFNGVQVGTVKQIYLSEFDPGRVIVLLSINANVMVTVNTYAEINSMGLSGIAYIGLKPGQMPAARLVATPGEKYPVLQTKPSLLSTITIKIEKAVNSLQNIAENINKIASDDNVKHIQNTLGNVDSLTTMLQKNNHDIDQTIRQLASFTQHLSKMGKALPGLIKQFNKSATEVQKMAQNMTQTGEQFNNQIIPQMSNSFETFNHLMTTLDDFAHELKEQPAVLIRGKVISDQEGDI